MTEQAIVETKQVDIENVLIQGDLSKLTAPQRLAYYKNVCQSLGVNPLTKPFDYIALNGKLVLYAKRDATDQLRKLHGISVTISARETVSEVYIVTARAQDKTGRSDESIGAVDIANLKGANLANAFMKAETKAKRRVTLSIVGLGWLDETEIETIPDAKPVVLEVEPSPAPQPEPVAQPSMDMSLETAEAVTNKDGTRYGDISTDKLTYMANALAKSLKDNHLEPDDRSTKLNKQDAIRIILAHRAEVKE